MKKRVLFIYPPKPNMKELVQNDEAAELPEIISTPPKDLMILAAIAEEVGCEAKIADYICNAKNADFVKDLIEFQPDFVVAHISTPTVKTDVASLQVVKAVCPKAKVVVKGACFLTQNINVIYETPFLDYILIEQPEYALKELLENTPDEDIYGIVYRKDFQGVMTPPRPEEEDLDAFPLPARHLIDNSVYKNEYDGKNYALIEVSRGCPYQCFFCPWANLKNRKVRYRSVDKIIEEIKYCVKEYSITSFVFDADLFDSDRKWVENLCGRLIQENLKITWSATLYPCDVTQEFAKLLYDSGCRFLYLGIESATQMVLDNLGKRLKLDKVRETVKTLKKAKIGLCASFINGLPWETKETAKATLNFALELDCDYTDFYLAFPMPGTKYYTLAKEIGLFHSITRPEYAFCYPIIRSFALTKEEIFALHEEMFKKVVLSPKRILKRFWRDKNFSRLKSEVQDVINIKKEQLKQKSLDKKSREILNLIQNKYLQKKNKK